MVPIERLTPVTSYKKSGGQTDSPPKEHLSTEQQNEPALFLKHNGYKSNTFVWRDKKLRKVLAAKKRPAFTNEML